MRGSIATRGRYLKRRLGRRLRIVALFDNDTAGSNALQGLKKVKLPRNIRVIQLPDLDLGKAYPTLGPGGSIVTNVNGLAGGIELYLGRDVLKDPEAQPLVDKGLFGDRFVPVQWRGYNQALKRYQGELLGKDQIRNRFFERTKAWRANPESCPDRDWSALKAIWDAIRMTFAE